MASDHQIITEETQTTEMDKSPKARANRNWLLLIFVLVGMYACDFARVYEDYKPIKQAMWHKDSVMCFNMNITDTVSVNNVFVNVRNKGNYPNSNLWLFVKINSPDGNCISDTIEYTLANLAGKWQGSGIGDIYDNKFPFKSNVRFPVSGEYKIEIQHGMRKSILKGISDIGVSVEKR